MKLQLNDVISWQHDFELFCSRYRPFFGRIEVQRQAQHYIHTLMSPLELKNGWTMAQAQDQRDPQPMQRLLSKAKWAQDLALTELQNHVRAEFATSKGVFLLDESGIVKSGDCSVGVKRQYCGAVGKTENCQVGVFLAYTSEHGHAILDGRLFLPEDWANDPQRRQKAHVPEELTFRTKPQLGLDMLIPLLDHGFEGEWVAADALYGNSPELRDALIIRGQKFVLGVSSNLHAWTKPPRLCGVQKRQGLAFEVCNRGPKKRSVREVAEAIKPRKWKRLRVFEGSKGPRLYDWAAKRVYVSQEGGVGPHLWLLCRRSVSEPSELAYYLCKAPSNASILELARVAANRWHVEQCFEEAKGEAGLDQYQTRSWHGWHRHMTLSMLAHLFLNLLKKANNREECEDGELSVPEIRRLLEIALPLPEQSVESKWRWSLWRRRHHRKAKLSHYRRRGYPLDV